MDFLTFDGNDVRVWLDGCEAYLSMYEIPDYFKVTSAMLHMTRDATYLYHAYKLRHQWPNCSEFHLVVMLEFDVNVLQLEFDVNVLQQKTK